MLRTSTALLRLTGVFFAFNSRSPLGPGAPYFGACSTRATALQCFSAPLASCARQKGTGAVSSRWRASKIAHSWRQRRASSSSAAPQRQKASKRRVASKARGQSRAAGTTTRQKTRGRPQQKRLSPHQRQAKKYNKRVEAIARLWKEQQQQQQQQHQQQQGASKRPEKRLISRHS